MTQDLKPLSPTFWSKTMGIKLYKENVAMSVVSRKEEATLKFGQSVDRPYRADVRIQKYTKGVALTAQDINATDDTLTVDQSFGMLIYVDDIDKVQNNWDAADVWSAECVTRLSNQIDAHIIYTGVRGANDTVDYNDLDSAQAAGLGIVLSISNVLKLFTVTKKKLTRQNVPQANRFFLISSEIEEVLMQYLAGRESVLGDATGQAGNIGKYMGFALFVTNNVTGYIRWTPGANPADTNTLTINGITITFVATIGTTEGNVLQSTDLATTMTNLAHLLNNNTTTANHVAFTGANKDAIESTFVATAAATYIDIWVKGCSYITSTSTVSSTYTYQKQLCLAGEIGAIDLVVQKNPSVKMASTVAAGKDGMNILPRTLFTAKVFYDMAKRLLSVEIDSSNY